MVHAESVSPKDDITVTTSDLINTLKGDGIVVNAASVSFTTESNQQTGIFSGYSFLFGSKMDAGVVFSTGNVLDVVGANSSDTTQTGFNGAIINDPVFGAVYDLVKLEFEVTPAENTLIVEYVFGSEEYNEFVNRGYNDFIRIFISTDGGATYNNCAVTANGLTVEIDGINNTTNSFLYKDNDFGDLGPNTPYNTEMDGFIKTVSCRYPVTPNQPVNVVIGMADDGDNIYDSWTFFKAQSLRSEPSNEFGDAPDSYQTLAASNGAAHIIVEGVYMGTMPSGDQDGFTDGVDDSLKAADDASDDGVLTFPVLDADTSTNYSITVNASSINGKGATLIGWIDFDGDGQFQADEASNAASLGVDAYETDVTLTWPTIGGAGPDIVRGTSYARIRMVNNDEIITSGDYAGTFLSGEVEDYQFQISGIGDTTAPVITIDAIDMATLVNQNNYPVSGDCTAGDLGVVVNISGATPASQTVICNGGSRWTASFDVSGIADGSGVIYVTATQDDNQGNSGAAFPVSADKDTVIPSVSINNAPASINNNPFTVTIQFSEDVSGFSVAEIVTANATVGNFTVVDAATYTADITPDGNGNITIDVGANVAQDIANNNNTAAAQVSVIYDITAPVVTVTAPVANAGNVAAYPVSGNCSNGDGDVTVSIAGAAPASQAAPCSGGSWSASFDVSGIGDAVNAISVTASQTDAAGNTGNASAQADKESEVPGVDIVGEPVVVNTTLPFNVSFQFTENVTGFDITDITTGNATVSNFASVDAATYTADITPTGSGGITIDVAAGVAQDGAGNNNTAAVQATVIYDAIAPVVSIDSAPGVNLSNAANYTVSGSCSTGDGNVTVSIAGATPASQAVACSSGSWSATFNVSAIADGVNVIGIDASQTDGAGNTGNAATVTVDKDTVLPGVSITGAPAATNGVFSITISFSEPVSGFTAADLVIGNGTAGNLTGSGASYTADITPNGSGNISIDIAANAAQDSVGNGNTAAGQVVVIFDNIAPAITIQNAPATVNSLAAYTVDFAFSESVTGFDINDIAVSNASTAGFTGSGASYSVDITPNGVGDITISINAGAAQDAAGNSSNAAAPVTTVFDNTPPVVSITSAPAANAANYTAWQVGGSCTAGDGNVSVVLTVAPLNPVVNSVNCDSSGQWSAVFDTSSYSDGAGILGLNASQTDTAGNQGDAAGINVDKDIVLPTVQFTNVPAIVNSPNEFSVTVAFSEDVSGFDSTDVTVNNGSATSITPVSASIYTVGITPDGTGDLSLDIAADAAQDSALNGNTAATQVTVSYDDVAPTVSIQGAPAIINTTAPFSVSLNFSEDVSGLLLSDIVVVNAVAGNLQQVSPGNYSVDITPDGAGNISIDLPAGAAQDIAGNDNTAAAQVVTVFDNVAPVVSINTPVAANASNSSAWPVSGSCTDGDSDVTVLVSGATPGSQAAACSGGSFAASFDVSAIADGTGVISIDASQTDVAGNTGNATTATADKDTVVPTVVLQNVPAISNATAFNITVAFSEPVNDFLIGDISLGNATAGNFVSVDASTYTVDITPDGNGDISIDVAAAVARDPAGNDNTAATQALVSFDNTAPVVSINAPAVVNAANAGAYTVSGSCSDGDGYVTVSIANAVPLTQNAACSGSSWSAVFDLTGIADGSGVVSIDASQTDTAGNTGNAAPAQADKDTVIAVPTVNPQTTNNPTPVITGTAEAAASLQINVGGADYSLSAANDGSWTLDTASQTPVNGSFSLLAGPNEVVVDSADAAGNTASDASSNEVTLTVDDDNDGIPNALECPGGPPYGSNCPDSDNDGTPDYLDTDSDGDGIPDSVEAGFDAGNPRDSDGDGTPDYLDTDSDGDGVPDNVEAGGNPSTPQDTDGDGIPDYVDIAGDANGSGDSDGDGIPDSVECPAWPACPDTDGNGQPDYLQTDSDGDGIPDATEAGGNPATPVDTDGDGTPDYRDSDSDGDGIDDLSEGTADVDADGIPDFMDVVTTGPGAGDSDGDGLADNIECPAWPDCPDADGDAQPDYMETDSDNDGIPGSVEAGTTGNDSDSDGIDDALDVDVTGGLDLNGDGIDDRLPLDTDGDGTPDYGDTDSDGDGLSDQNECDTGLPCKDTDADGIPDYLDADSSNNAGTADGSGDSDGDGISDLDECPAWPACPDTDADGTPDYMDSNPDDGPLGDADGDGRDNYLDPDADNDGIPDVIEDPNFDADNNPATNPLDTDNDGTPDYLDLDSDDDGLSDALESGSVGRDSDGDNIDDYYDVDTTGGSDLNGDGVDDNVRPLDTDGDSVPDFIDPVFDGDRSQVDNDGDGMSDELECPVFPTDCPDTDNDGRPDFLDTDSDGDGIPDAVEVGPDPARPRNTDGDSLPDYRDTDSDNDGLTDAVEGTADTDNDGIPGYLDADQSGAAYGGDSDGDGVPDLDECSSFPACADSDTDGIPDYMDAGSQPYNPDDVIETGVKGIGGSSLWTLLLLLAVMLGFRMPGGNKRNKTGKA